VTVTTHHALARGGRFLTHRYTMNVAAAALSIGAIWFGWWAAVTGLHAKSYVACTPAQAFDAITQNWSFLQPLVWSTIQLTFFGFAAGTIAGLLLATVMSRVRLLEQLLYPTVITSQAIPVVALAPLLVLIFNFTDTPIVIVVAVFTFFPITINTLGAFKAVDPDLVDLARALGSRRWRRFTVIELPSAVPGLLAGLKIASVYAVSGAIISELFDTTSASSLGYNQARAIASYNTPLIYGDTIVMTVMSLVWFLAVVGLGYLATPWLHRDEAPRWWRGGRTDVIE
jgi:ABC-type nitrate/sulfonate/bicarbonate transport system permease component